MTKEEFENKDWLGENIQTLRPINIKNFIIFDNDNYKLFNSILKLDRAVNISYTRRLTGAGQSKKCNSGLFAFFSLNIFWEFCLDDVTAIR